MIDDVIVRFVFYPTLKIKMYLNYKQFMYNVPNIKIQNIISQYNWRYCLQFGIKQNILY